MPGRQPDPAHSMDVIAMIQHHVTQGIRDALPDVTKTLADVATAKSNLQHESRYLPLPVAVPILIAGYDRMRVRALIRATVPGVYIGTLAQLTGGFGYLVSNSQGEDIHTISEIYAVYTPAGAPDPTAAISMWFERSA